MHPSDVMKDFVHTALIKKKLNMGIVYQSGMGFAPGDVEYAMR